MKIAWQDISDVQDLVRVGEALEKIKLAIESTEYKSPLKVVYHQVGGEAKMEIEKADRSIRKITIGSNQEIRQSEFNNYFDINLKRLRAQLWLDEIGRTNELLALDFKQIADSIAIEIGEKPSNRHRYSINTEVIENKVGNLNIDKANALDELELSWGIGAGVIRNTIAPDMGLRLVLRFRNKNNLVKRKMGVLTTLHYLFDRGEDGDFNMHINTFVSGFYGFNLSGDKDPRWLSLGIGYLVNESGGYFSGDTFKITAQFETNWNSVDIAPELFITDDFGTIFPGIRFGLTF
ncbi:MAG: hypothetical protein AAFX87_30900 [Bacteroidota bacterium]